MFLAVDERGRIAAFEDRPTGAAHSMDTDWYAVDRHGEIALLESGEEGAVPWNAHRQYWEALYFDLAIARIAAITPPEPFADDAALRRAMGAASDPAEAELLTAILAGDEASRAVYADWLEQRALQREPTVYLIDHVVRTIDSATLPGAWDGVLRFASSDYLELFRAEYGYFALRDALGLRDALEVSQLPRYAFDDYWEAGVITAAYVIGRAASPRAFGLYEYACGFSGPYTRRAVPRTPLVVDQLPEPLRGQLGRLRLPVVFHTTTDFDPDRLVDCQRYGE